MTALRRFGLLAPIAAISLAGCGLNSVPTAEEAVNAQWANVQADYQRRANLIPNLVNTVKGYAQQERTVLTEVTNARANATRVQLNAGDLTDPGKVKAFADAQSQLGGSLSRLIATFEAYPDLKSNANFLALQDQLEGTENRITVARNRFIQAVQDFNVTVRKFPTNLTAMIFGYKVKPNFTVADEAAVSKPPTVDFGTPPAPAPTVPEPAPTTEPTPEPST